MLNGINKKPIIWVGFFILLIFLVIKVMDTSSAICDKKCQELKYNKMVDMGQYNKYGIDLSKKLNGMRIGDNQDTIVKIKELFGDEIKKMTLVERMSVDYDKECKDLPYNDILKGKVFCQVAIIEFTDGQIGYVLGKCEHDLMGFTKSYDKLGFDLIDRVQYLLPNDQVLIENIYEVYSISSKEYKVISVNCNL